MVILDINGSDSTWSLGVVYALAAAVVLQRCVSQRVQIENALNVDIRGIDIPSEVDCGNCWLRVFGTFLESDGGYFTDDILGNHLTKLLRHLGQEILFEPLGHCPFDAISSPKLELNRRAEVIFGGGEVI